MATIKSYGSCSVKRVASPLITSKKSPSGVWSPESAGILSPSLSGLADTVPLDPSVRNLKLFASVSLRWALLLRAFV